MSEKFDYGHLGLSEEQVDLLSVAWTFCKDKSPIEKIRSLMETDCGFDPEVWDEVASLGWLGIAIPEEYEGGIGLGLGEAVPIVEQMGRSMMHTPFVSTTLTAQCLLLSGTKQQKEKYLPKLATGTIGTMAFMEKQCRWDFSNIQAKAIENKEGRALTGTKTFVSDADKAQILLVLVMRDEKPTIVILERNTIPDHAIRRETIIDETKRSYEIILDNLKYDDVNILDADLILSCLTKINLAMNLFSAAESCGAALSVIDYTTEYLKTRKQFGKTIGAYQGLKHPIVDALIEYEQARSHLYSAAHNFNEQGLGEIAVHMAKVQADKTLTFAADRSIQFHGGFGFTYDCDAQLYRRRAAWHSAIYGDGAYHKKKLAALMF